MTRYDWIRQALPILESRLWNLSDHFATTEDKPIPECSIERECLRGLIEEHALLTELRRVAIEDFGIEGEHDN